jgi:hypothetical protein
MIPLLPRGGEGDGLLKTTYIKRIATTSKPPLSTKATESENMTGKTTPLLVAAAAVAVFHALPLSHARWTGNPSAGNFNGDLHHLMNADELLHYFQVSESHLVDASSYQLVTVERREVVTKRGGDAETDHDREVALTAFGKEYNLRLVRNTELLAANAQIKLTGGGDEPDRTLKASELGESCHYQVLGGQGVTAGGLSDCGRGFSGFVKDGNKVFDVIPLRPR